MIDTVGAVISTQRDDGRVHLILMCEIISAVYYWLEGVVGDLVANPRG